MDDAFGGTPHRPVLYQEIIHALRPTSGGLYVDGTVGAGGHARGILQASSPHGRLLGLDVDAEAISLARQRLASFGSRAILIHASYATLAAQLEALGWPQVNGVLLDLGLSSMQLDTPQRGFSFQAEAPLDMRFDQTKLVTAANLVNTLTESELADILFRYGEERQARQIARAVVNARPLYTTSQLAEIVLRSSTKSSRSAGRDISARGHLHPATRTFQALRIAVNRELESLETALPQAVEALMPGGRLAVIAFHSLEDRIVKQYFRRESRDCLCPPRQPACTCGHHAVLGELTRQPIRPAPQEVQENPRSRSARLRVAEKLAQIDS